MRSTALTVAGLGLCVVLASERVSHAEPPSSQKAEQPVPAPPAKEHVPAPAKASDEAGPRVLYRDGKPTETKYIQKDYAYMCWALPDLAKRCAAKNTKGRRCIMAAPAGYWDPDVGQHAGAADVAARGQAWADQIRSSLDVPKCTCRCSTTAPPRGQKDPDTSVPPSNVP